MKFIKQILTIIFITLLLSSCFGDKKTAVGQDFDTDDFENTNFEGNKVNFKDLPQNMCSYLNSEAILNQYSNGTSVTYDDGKRFGGKNCNFKITFFDTASSFSMGSIFIVENLPESETNWKEDWEFQKKMKSSTAYVSNLGKAAIWYAKQRKLDIKMDGYTISITAPIPWTSATEFDKNAALKDVAIALAKRTNLF